MDAAILHERLAAAEGAIIKTDERLDALENDEQADDHAQALIACDARIAALEETLTECLNRLQELTSQTATTEAEIAEAEADVAQAEAAVAVAEALEAQAEAEPEPEAEMLVEEIPPEPEPENPSESEVGPASSSRSPNWLERLLALH